MSEDVAGVQSAFRRWRARRSLARFLFSIWFVALPACRPFGRGASPPAQVVISEFVAVNDGATIDEDGDASDWVELYNQGPTDVDLTGWYLTDERRDPVRWQFPQVILPANGYLVVFASGKDRAAAGSELHANFSLSGEGEYLGLFAPDGRTVVWEYGPHYPPQYEGAAYGLVAARQARYFTAPTPGAANGSASENQGPVLSNVAHHPAVPAPGQDVAVTVRAAGALAPLKAVTLYWRVMYGATQATPMRDDGAHEEGDAGDGVYGATIPSSLHEPGQMVRYYVVATDRRGQDARWPLRGEGTGGPHYCGTMIADPAVQSELPVLYWFVADPTAAETDAGSRASVFYDGVLYDNVLVRLRGLTARYWPKKSLKFDFNQGHHFRYARDRAPVEEFNLNATVTDKSYLRQVLSWEAYRDAGVPSSISFPVRVQRNGRFYSVAIFVEQPDERYLLRQGLDPEGALYKMLKRNLLDSATSNVEKRTRLDEDASDLQGLIDGLNLLPRERTRFMFEQVNVPEVINYLAVATVLHDRDQGDNNYYMYRGAGASDRWMVLPWDKDMTFGRTYLPDAGGTFNDVIWADQDPESHPLQPYYVGNRLFDALLADPVIREMYLRRLRTVMDLLLQPPGTPASARVFERRIDAWYDQMAADVALDAERWPLEWGEPQSFAQAVAAIVDGYLPARRVHLYQTHGASGSGLVPEAQPRRVRVRFGEVELDPPSGNQDEEYLTLVNDNPYAVDVSGWKVVYDVEYTFQPGVVIPAGDRIYVSPDVAAFYRRYGDVPGMGERLVQGNYRGQLSNTWGALKLYDAGDRLVNMQVFHDRDLLDR